HARQQHRPQRSAMPMANGETGALARPPFTLAPPPLARYTLVRDLGPVFPSRVDRLDARLGLRPDVPYALSRAHQLHEPRSHALRRAHGAGKSRLLPQPLL